MISFNEVPSVLRYPGAYVEIDGSQAGLSGDMPAVLLVGQKLATGTAAAGEVTRVASVGDAIAKAGAGSMLARMAAAYRAVDTAFDLYMLPYADNGAGVAATGTLTVTAGPTAAGTLSLYVGAALVSVGLTAGMTAAQVATAIAAAIASAGTSVDVTATAAAAVVTLTARHKGTCGNSTDVRLNMYGETTPTGLTLSIAAMTGGTGDPATGDLASILGTSWYRYVVLGINDAATLAAWHTESQRRYKVPVQAGFRAFAAYRGDYASAATFGSSKNYEHICMAWAEYFPTAPWVTAAVLAAGAAPKLYNNPTMSLESTSLPGVVGTQSYNDFTTGNSLLFKGMSVLEVARDGSVSIKRLITMYQTRSDGSADDSWLDLNTPEVMERIRYEQRMGAVQQFRSSIAAKSNEGYRPGLRIVTEDDVKAFLLSLYKEDLMKERGWVQAYDYYKKTLVVEQNAQNPSRFDFQDDPVITSPFYILAGRSSFRKSAPTT